MTDKERSRAGQHGELPRVNGERLRRWMAESSAIGLDSSLGSGLHRRALSAADLEGRRWLAQLMAEQGLDVSTDGALNQHGRLGLWEGRDKPSLAAPAVVTGSHHDSVAGGGALDGALGVLAGVEALTRLKELGVELKRPVEVVNFTDEEGRFGGMLGSMCMAGQLTPAQLDKMVAADGASAADLLAAAAGVPREQAVLDACAAAYSPGSVRAFVELHIEQGPVLDAAQERVGLVRAIVGLWKAEFTLTGQANHAGTTPMSMRRDAFGGCAAVRVALPQLLAEHGVANRTVCTMGSIKVVPNCPNVVPGECAFTVEVRDEQTPVVAAMANAVRALVAREAVQFGLDFSERVMSDMPAVAADPALVGTLAEEAEAFGFPNARVMASGASHDAQQMAKVGPMAMVFVPSINGVSHHHTEATDWEDIEAGANLLLRALLRLATEGDFKAEKQEEERGAAEGGKEEHQAATTTKAAEIEDGASHAPASAGAATKVSKDSHSSTRVDSQTTLVCIDLQRMPPTTAREGVDFDADDVAWFESALPPVLGRVAAVQESFRQAQREVVHCRIASRTADGRDRSALHKRMGIHVPPSRDAGEDWLPGIAPAHDEMVFDKTGSNAFITTNLEYVLRNVGAEQLVFCGVLTDECVAGTVKAAADLGFSCVVLEDACLAATPDRHDAALCTVRRFATVCTTREWLA